MHRHFIASSLIAEIAATEGTAQVEPPKYHKKNNMDMQGPNKKVLGQARCSISTFMGLYKQRSLMCSRLPVSFMYHQRKNIQSGRTPKKSADWVKQLSAAIRNVPEFNMNFGAQSAKQNKN